MLLTPRNIVDHPFSISFYGHFMLFKLGLEFPTSCHCLFYVQWVEMRDDCLFWWNFLPSLFKPSFHNSAARTENETVPDIMVVKSVTIKKNNIKPAVVGGFVKHEKIFSILTSETEQYCQEDSNITCYLLDDGAFMISSNQRDKLKKVL